MPSGGRHRAPQHPSTVRKVLRTTGAVTALVSSGLAVTAAPAGAATADDFAKLRQCESGGNYQINTGNNYYGAYQFDTGTWRGLGYSGLPSDAPSALQDEAAYKLYNSRGWSPWPSCAAKMGLTRNGPAPSSSAGTSSAGAIERAITPAQPAMTLDRAKALLDSADFTGTTLSSALSGEVRPDAYVWQSEMRQKKFILQVDGRFGRESQGLASLYSYLTRVDDGKAGVVGKNLWDVTVTNPTVL
ncbi:transglycosylase family protein [Protofrankia symbiont of Coriaria ruscifolia]|uniref:Transglycosylase-like domain-containing protein n=1 Tax=Candidatus Protofrankia californiensis TaxID=1839754 RepID=A0A1C3NUL2_9ACTN|nr:transglycosylase family protein [Protofrankia symbiont of Coriaria ruscifolia]SBW18982.1 transglycosylase-like domain-containing protein [Candidatus Protofrankia californiensis]